MNRTVPVLFGVLLLTLIGFGVLADRALVGQGRAAREATAAKADETARSVALSIRAALAHVEQSVSSGQSPDGATSERLALPPPRSFPLVPVVPYAQRPRGELARLLSSDAATPSGLPEAVVVRLVVGEAPLVTGSVQPPKVEDRLLSGQIPVRPEDLPELARRLGLDRDPRVRVLQERLQRLPPAEEIPTLPAFRRRLSGGATVEGWSRSGSTAMRYAMPVTLLLSGASRVGRVTAASASDGGAVSRGAPPTPSGLTRVVTVPDVEGLVLSVTLDVPGALRLAALRLVLLVTIAVGVFVSRLHAEPWPRKRAP